MSRLYIRIFRSNELIFPVLAHAPDYSSYYYDQYKVAVYTNLFTGIVCGTYIVLYATSVYVLLRHPGFTSSRPRMIMFGTTTFMFILGIIALVLATTIMFQEMLSVVEQVSDGGASLASYLAWAILTRLMYILCDIICAWRTVVLWNRDKRVIAILLIFILGTTVASVFAYGIALESELEPGTSNAFDLVMVCPTLATNLLSTGLIAWKAWKRRISIRKHLFERSGFARVDRIFALLIESGLIYCCIWMLYLISLFGVLPNPGFTAMAFISGLYLHS
ncbi:hypothetical protein EI94DRAFT_133536 [Lactarius quietus]|nr:hypothetical protein EI94DRAFT_133536 [Lactarius quietus]